MCATSFSIRTTAFKSLLRLLQGLLRYDCHVNRTIASNPEQLVTACRILSIDLFDTLLLRSPGIVQFTRMALSKRMVADLEIPVLLPANILGMLDDIEADMRNSLWLEGFDPEISRTATYDQLLQNLAFQGDISEMAHEWVEFELNQLALGIRLNPVILELIESANAAGTRVIAISDMHFSAQELAVLLKKLGAPTLASIYVSSDIGFSKFRGGLYDHVLISEGIGPEEMLHIGDNRWADVYSARQKGIRSLHLCPPKLCDVRRTRQSGSSKEYCLGYGALGPVFATFAHLLLLQSVRVGIKHLAFVARDGDLLKQATECLASNAAFLPQPTFHYLYLSRCSTALPAVDRLDESELAKVAYIRAGGSLLQRFIDYFGLSEECLTACLDSHGLDLTNEYIKEEAIWPLLYDPFFKQYVDGERIRQRNLLKTYLRQQMIFADEATALVDIGWRGSIQRALNKAFHCFSLKGLYFGYWCESGKINSEMRDSQGVISDIQRGRSLLEGSAWYTAFILEAICREDCGTVTGYQELENGRVYPVFKENTKNRDKEKISEKLQKPIRQGILDFIEDYANYECSALLNEKKVRRKSQLRLLRLAFFPNLAEITILGGLSQTEGHATTWSQTLIAQERPNPLLAPRRWLAGLSSPWRFGYVAATGGYTLVSLAVVLEAGLLACPSSFRDRLRTMAMGLARQGRDDSRINGTNEAGFD